MSVSPACGRHDMPVVIFTPFINVGALYYYDVMPFHFVFSSFPLDNFLTIGPFWKVPSSFVTRNKTMDLIMDFFCSLYQSILL